MRLLHCKQYQFISSPKAYCWSRIYCLGGLWVVAELKWGQKTLILKLKLRNHQTGRWRLSLITSISQCWSRTARSFLQRLIIVRGHMLNFVLSCRKHHDCLLECVLWRVFCLYGAKLKILIVSWNINKKKKITCPLPTCPLSTIAPLLAGSDTEILPFFPLS